MSFEDPLGGVLRKKLLRLRLSVHVPEWEEVKFAAVRDGPLPGLQQRIQPRCRLLLYAWESPRASNTY